MKKLLLSLSFLFLISPPIRAQADSISSGQFDINISFSKPAPPVPSPIDGGGSSPEQIPYKNLPNNGEAQEQNSLIIGTFLLGSAVVLYLIKNNLIFFEKGRKTL